MESKRTILSLALFLCLLIGGYVSNALAQVTTPVVSPYAKVSEQIGLTDITITYGRPAVNGRDVWGALVPYGLAAPAPGFGSGNPIPWRAGANENTTITFEDDVMIEGKKLTAGTYGLHMIPGENDWTIIFSHNASSWGSFFYDEKEDALRVKVKPEEAPHRERLQYTFEGHDGPDKVKVAMHWEKKKVAFGVQVANIHEVVLASMRNELRSRGGFSWQGYVTAANYALRNNVNLDEAITWADVAIGQNKNFNTLQVKANLLNRKGMVAESNTLMQEAIPLATENQLNAYGYQLMGQNQLENALEVFKLNVKNHPDSWNPHDSLGECYASMGDAKNAVKYYKLALEKLPANDQANQDRINKVLADLNAAGSK